MIVRKDLFFNERGESILITSGIHGNETHAVSACYNLYKSLKGARNLPYVKEIIFLFNVNEYGLEQDTRDNNYEKEISKNCNRLFPKEYKTSEEIKEYIEHYAKCHSFSLVLDVHNSPSCIPCVLVDCDENMDKLLSKIKDTQLIPLVRATTIGTVKKLFNRNRDTYAYTVELPGMGESSNISSSVTMLKDFIEKTIKNITENEEYMKLCVTPVQELYTRTDNGIITYKRGSKETLGRYDEDELIAEVENMETGEVEIINAPYDGILYDIDENLYAYSGKCIGLYGKAI